VFVATTPLQAFYLKYKSGRPILGLRGGFMPIIERLFQIRSLDPTPYCPRAFLQKIYNLAFRKQGFLISETNTIRYYAELRKNKVILVKKNGQSVSEILGSVEILKNELSNINL